MEISADTYRVKVHREDSPTRLYRAAKKNSSYTASNQKGNKSQKDPHKSEKRKKSKRPTLSSLKQSVTDNCCACCVVLAEYWKESFKLICSCLNEKPTQTRVCELFCELLRLTWCFGSDCVSFVWYILRILFVMDDEKKEKK